MKRLSFVFVVVAAFDAFALGLVPEDPARNWKCVYSSSEGPEGKALCVLTEKVGALTLRNGELCTSHVFPLERVGAELLLVETGASVPVFVI